MPASTNCARPPCHRLPDQSGKSGTRRSPGVSPPQPAGVLATAVPGSRERRDDHAAAGQAGAGESPAGSLSLRGLPRRCRGSFARNCRPSSRCACECPPGRPGTRRRPGRASGDRDRPRRRRSGPVAAIRIRWPGPAGAVRVRTTGRPGFPRSRCGRTGDGADAAPRSRLRGADPYRPGRYSSRTARTAAATADPSPPSLVAQRVSRSTMTRSAPPGLLVGQAGPQDPADVLGVLQPHAQLADRLLMEADPEACNKFDSSGSHRYGTAAMRGVDTGRFSLTREARPASGLRSHGTEAGAQRC